MRASIMLRIWRCLKAFTPASLVSPSCPTIPAEVVIGPITILLTICIVMLAIVGNKIIEGETVMRNDEVDALVGLPAGAAHVAEPEILVAKALFTPASPLMKRRTSSRYLPFHSPQTSQFGKPPTWYRPPQSQGSAISFTCKTGYGPAPSAAYLLMGAKKLMWEYPQMLTMWSLGLGMRWNSSSSYSKTGSSSTALMPSSTRLRMDTFSVMPWKVPCLPAPTPLEASAVKERTGISYTISWGSSNSKYLLFKFLNVITNPKASAPRYQRGIRLASQQDLVAMSALSRPAFPVWLLVLA
ncbi:MAG: hypothetical protein FRX49_06676 [Trebouxia sp. A1-2]|nr:MAG: hypothetical protein FRX49_06676 [Trebouxia sp. A1-2]